MPTLIPSPEAGVALGDATAVARGGSPGVGTGGIAAPVSSPKVSVPVAVSTPRPGVAHPGPVLAVSAGRAVQAATPVPVSAAPAPEPEPSPEPATTPPAPSADQAPAPPLVASAPPSGSPGTTGRPGTSVVGGGEPERICEGDEYVITATFEEAESDEGDPEEAEADIVVRQIEADGSETEVQLRGDLSDVRGLIATLVGEGNCVDLEFGTAAEDGTPSGGTSPVVVPPEGVPSPVPDLVSGDQAAPNSP